MNSSDFHNVVLSVKCSTSRCVIDWKLNKTAYTGANKCIIINSIDINKDLFATARVTESYTRDELQRNLKCEVAQVIHVAATRHHPINWLTWRWKRPEIVVCHTSLTHCYRHVRTVT